MVMLSDIEVLYQIADLEISNQSLLAVNTMLESTVRKQAMQILELQRSKARLVIYRGQCKAIAYKDFVINGSLKHGLFRCSKN